MLKEEIDGGCQNPRLGVTGEPEQLNAKAKEEKRSNAEPYKFSEKATRLTLGQIQMRRKRFVQLDM